MTTRLVAANRSSSAGSHNALVVVHSIQLDRSGANPIASGGSVVVHRKWTIDDEALTPVSFRYRVPSTP
ncbi:hypothetical protein [Nocardia sp. XZ_19_385]|uniref:hypothetical protein n=1 Tax=Nocardia sp. XZ_19_385 TaxID=2769488 RepID=UPI00188FF971|nr:hypothetical protein [Nocardia sp. XZ_19_385]